MKPELFTNKGSKVQGVLTSLKVSHLANSLTDFPHLVSIKGQFRLKRNSTFSSSRLRQGQSSCGRMSLITGWAKIYRHNYIPTFSSKSDRSSVPTSLIFSSLFFQTSRPLMMRRPSLSLVGIGTIGFRGGILWRSSSYIG